MANTTTLSPLYRLIRHILQFEVMNEFWFHLEEHLRTYWTGLSIAVTRAAVELFVSCVKCEKQWLSMSSLLTGEQNCSGQSSELLSRLCRVQCVCTVQKTKDKRNVWLCNVNNRCESNRPSSDCNYILLLLSFLSTGLAVHQIITITVSLIMVIAALITTLVLKNWQERFLYSHRRL